MADQNLQKFSKEAFDLAKNVVFLGGLKYFADKSGSDVLLYFYYLMNGILIAYLNSYVNVSFLMQRVAPSYRFRRKLAWLVGLVSVFVFLLVVNIAIDQAIKSISQAQALSQK